MEAKRLLGRTIADLYHGEGAGAAAEAEFDRVFKAHADARRTSPTGRSPPRSSRSGWPGCSRWSGLVPSNKEGRRKIEQGGVRIAGERVADPDLEVDADAVAGQLVQVGKRAWARIVVRPG